MLTIKDIAHDLKVSGRYVYDLVKREDFPRPVILSKGIRRWPPEDYERWKRGLKRER